MALLSRTVIESTIGYPIYLARTLMQLGYEPQPPDELGRLPNLFAYITIIRRERGYSALYTGLSYHLASVLIKKAFYDEMSKPYKKQDQSSQNDEPSQVIQSSQNGEPIQVIAVCVRESVLKVYSCLITYPLVTLGVGYISTVFFGAKENIDYTVGYLYKGIIPRLLIEVAMVWVTTISKRVTKSLIDDEFAQDIVARVPPFIVQSILYPLNVVCTVMADNGRCGMNPKFSDWRECFSYLQSNNQLKRGSAFLFRRDYQYIAGSQLTVRRYF